MKDIKLNVWQAKELFYMNVAHAQIMCKNTSMFKEIVIHEDVMEWIIKVFLWKSTVNRSRTQQPCLCQEMV